MANEIQVTTKLVCKNGNLSVSRTPNQFQVDQAAAGAAQGFAAIATSATSISLGSVSAAGWAYFYNTDETNYVEIGPDNAGTFVPFMRLQPGDSAVVALTPSITLKAQAHTATVLLEYVILQA